MNGELTPLPVDDESLVEYIKKKMPEWHVRLNQSEKEIETVKKYFEKNDTKLNEIHTAILGSTDGEKRGIFRRIEIIEAWKTVISWEIGRAHV